MSDDLPRMVKARSDDIAKLMVWREGADMLGLRAMIEAQFNYVHPEVSDRS